VSGAVLAGPGIGKSPSPPSHELLNDASPGSCALLPADGFHYDDEVLVAAMAVARGAAYVRRGWLRNTSAVDKESRCCSG
jgi:pantothenate kinase